MSWVWIPPEQAVRISGSTSWIADQYYNPHETWHSIDEVLGWFRENDVEYLNTSPAILGTSGEDAEGLFDETDPGNRAKRIVHPARLAGDDRARGRALRRRRAPEGLIWVGVETYDVRRDLVAGGLAAVLGGSNICYRQATKLRWFDRGARALAQSFPNGLDHLGTNLSPLYICPLCIELDETAQYFRFLVDSKNARTAGRGQVRFWSVPDTRSAARGSVKNMDTSPRATLNRTIILDRSAAIIQKYGYRETSVTRMARQD